MAVGRNVLPAGECRRAHSSRSVTATTAKARGESCGTAVEGAMHVTAIVDLIKGGGPAWPRIETDTHLMCIGSGRPLDWRRGEPARSR